MKNGMKKAVLFVISFAMCMNITMPVFASESVTDPEVALESVTDSGTNAETERETQDFPLLPGGYVTGESGDRTDIGYSVISEEVEKVLKDEEAVKNILEDSGYKVSNDSKVVVVGAADLELNGEAGDLSSGADVTLYLGSKVGEYLSNPEVAGLENGDTVYLLHQKDDGTWEVIEGIVEVRSNSIGSTSYMVKAVMTGFSPVAIIKIMSNGDVIVLDKEGNAVTKVETSSTENGNGTVKTSVVTEKKSPKTGE